MSGGPGRETESQGLTPTVFGVMYTTAEDIVERTMRIEKYGQELGDALHGVLIGENRSAISPYRESDGAMLELAGLRLRFAIEVAAFLDSHDGRQRTTGVEAQMEYARGVGHLPVIELPPTTGGKMA